jgi:hypothetical protein
VDVATELKDSTDFTAPVFRFLSRTISAIGLLSLLLLLPAPADQRMTVLCFAVLTLAVGGSLHFIRGSHPAADGHATSPTPVTSPAQHD